MKTTVKKITAWSFSRYSDWEQCPLKAKLKHVDKIKEPGSAAMERGSMIHGLAENWIKGIIKKLPPELAKVEEEMEVLRAAYRRKLPAMSVEDQWAFTKDWEVTDWFDMANCVIRIKLDCAHEESDGVLVVTDHKTGKFRPEQEAEYLKQLQLYALGAFLMKPHIHTVRPRLLYIDQGTVHPPADDPIEYFRSELPKLKKVWEKRVAPMLADTKFAPKPNRFCYNCHFRRGNEAAGGGQCPL